MIRLWLREHPKAFSAATVGLMFVLGLLIFGDARAGLISGIYGGVLVFLAWRTGGFGWKLDAKEASRMEQGIPAVRTDWLLRAVLWVLAVTAAIAVVLWLSS
jgi:hypothetical protein